MPERSDAETRMVRTFSVVCLALVLAVVVPSALFAMGWPELGFILFAAIVFLWPILGLFSAWALRRRDQ